MSTWHQTRSGPVKLTHPTEWTVVIDPPNDLRSAISFTNEAQAREYMARVKHAYLLPPMGVQS